MKTSDTKLLRLIALFKLFKAALLVAVGVGALRLVHTNVTTLVEKWVARFGLNPGSGYVGHIVLEAASLTPNRIKDLGVGSLLYAALFLTEGIGLWLTKRWALWFSTIITCSLVPLEVHEIYRHPTATKVLVLVINIAVVGFLIYRLRSQRTNK
jgi:uncharacterized membrane protein (DUF2068 family)